MWIIERLKRIRNPRREFDQEEFDRLRAEADAAWQRLHDHIDELNQMNDEQRQEGNNA
jgi:hypothetical protein